MKEPTLSWKNCAGNPIEAITGSFEQISVPNYLINGIDEHFTLEVTETQ